MDAEKPFEVGEWVWWWGASAFGSNPKWIKILRIDGEMLWFSGDAREAWVDSRHCTHNPVIPPKPKEKRTVEVIGETNEVSLGRYIVAVRNTGGIPRGATNIRILYDIEE